MARGSISDLLNAKGGQPSGGRVGSPVKLDPSNRGDGKGGQPTGGVPMTKPHDGGRPPSGGTPAHPPPKKGGTPIDRPWGPGPVPPGTPTTKPPSTKPPATTPKPIPGPGEQPTPDPGSTGPKSPDWGPGTGGDFSKGQVRDQQMPGGGYFDPTMQALFSGGFNPYGGSSGGGGGGGNKGGQPGGGYGGGWGDGGYHNGGSGGSYGGASTYDPLGIGQDNYYGGPYKDLPSSNQNVYDMTGVNAATGYRGPARYGVVGGQGGYGVGMVGPEYSGPIFNDARVALKAMRKQRRELNKPIQAIPGGGGVGGPGTPAAAPAAASTTTPAATPAVTGGNQVDNKGGQPAGQPNLLGRLGRINDRLAADPNNAALQARQQRVAGRVKGGQPGAAPAAPGAAPAAPGATPAAAPTSGGLGSGLAQTGTPAQTGVPQSYYEGSTFNSPYGQLVQSSVGNGNIYKQQGSDGSHLYHYDPSVGWKHMTSQEYTGYNNPADFYKDPNQYAAQAGGVQNQYQKNANGMWQTKVGTGTYR